jgi:hypothetical protein
VLLTTLPDYFLNTFTRIVTRVGAFHDTKDVNSPKGWRRKVTGKLTLQAVRGITPGLPVIRAQSAFDGLN